jgi:hypothetical protein
LDSNSSAIKKSLKMKIKITNFEGHAAEQYVISLHLAQLHMTPLTEAAR